MTKRMWLRRLLIVAGVLTLGGIGWAATSSERPDCPGKIVCPLTGKLICKDRCPANAAIGKVGDTAVPPCCSKGT